MAGVPDEVWRDADPEQLALFRAYLSYVAGAADAEKCTLVDRVRRDNRLNELQRDYLLRLLGDPPPTPYSNGGLPPFYGW
jgi:hypothetical protein